MSELDVLIAFWQIALTSLQSAMEEPAMRFIEQTIKALEELKKLKGE